MENKKLEKQVLELIKTKYEHVAQSGFYLNNIIGASPNGKNKKNKNEIKCPNSIVAIGHYLKDGKPTKPYYGQMQLRKCIWPEEIVVYL